MKLWFKKKIRNVVNRLNWYTEQWVIPSSMYKLLDEGRFEELEAIVKQKEKEWPKDPELVRFTTYLYFERA